MKHKLTYDDCQMIVNHLCEKVEKTKGKPLAITIVDVGGNILCRYLMDGIAARAGQLTYLKANTAARFLWETESFANFLRDRNEDVSMYCQPNTTMMKGGSPIYNKEKECIGGVGISGWTPEQDQELSNEIAAMFA